MWRALSLSIAITFLVCLLQLKAADPPATPSADADKPRPIPETELVLDEIPMDVFRSVRIVRDLAQFDVLSLRPQGTEAWIVARIQPGGLSGAGHLQGGYIKAETGEFVDKGARPVILIGGQWKRLELLSGEAPLEGRFEWKEPHVERAFDRRFNIYDTYSVFSGKGNDGTVICRFFADRKGAEQFSSVTAIPDGWERFVKAALAYHVRHAADVADNDLNRLRKMATDDNPFIALTAIRHILVLGRTTTDEEIDRLADLARSLPKFRQAVLTFWLLKPKDDDSRDTLLKAISRTKNTAELTGMALGIESWKASQPQPFALSHRESTRSLLDTVVERWRSFNPSTAEDEDLKIWRRILIAPESGKR